MFKKISLPVLLTLICVSLLVIFLLYGFTIGKFTFLQKKPGNQTLVKTEEKDKINRTDYTDIARKTLDWIDKQRNEEGWYILGKTCGEKGCDQIIDDKEVGNKDGLIATWVRLNFYEEHQEAKDLEIVKKDIDLFYDKYKDKDLSDSLWLCKVTYEMAQSKYLDQGQKEKLKELCFSIEELDDEGLNSYWFERFKREIAVKYPPVSWDYYSLRDRYYDNFFGRVSDLVYKYLWSSDKKYLSLIDKFYNEEERLILERKGIESQNKCLFGISVLDIYKHIDKSNMKFDYVVNYYKTLESDPTKEYLTNPICGIFLSKIYEINNNIDYLKKIENKVDLIIKNNQRDEKGNIVDGFVRSDLSKGGFDPDRNVIDNSLLLELIR